MILFYNTYMALYLAMECHTRVWPYIPKSLFKFFHLEWILIDTMPGQQLWNCRKILVTVKWNGVIAGNRRTRASMKKWTYNDDDDGFIIIALMSIFPCCRHVLDGRQLSLHVLAHVLRRGTKKAGPVWHTPCLFAPAPFSGPAVCDLQASAVRHPIQFIFVLNVQTISVYPASLSPFIYCAGISLVTRNWL